MTPTAEAPHGYLAAQLGAILEKARGTTPQRQKARDVGVAPATLRELEEGTANPTLRRIEDVAASYGLELELRVKPRRGGAQ